MAEKACEQIKNQKYIEGLYADGYEDIIGYGIAFHKKSCVITSLKDIWMLTLKKAVITRKSGFTVFLNNCLLFFIAYLLVEIIMFSETSLLRLMIQKLS